MKVHAKIFLTFISLLLVSTGCSTSGASVDGKTTGDIIEVHDSSLSLVDYIRRAGGVSIQTIDGRTFVRIRGNASFNSNAEPLYVVDGVRFGNSFGRVEQHVPPEFIKSIEVLKGAEAASRYGMQASSGAIIITTK